MHLKYWFIVMRRLKFRQILFWFITQLYYYFCLVSQICFLNNCVKAFIIHILFSFEGRLSIFFPLVVLRNCKKNLGTFSMKLLDNLKVFTFDNEEYMRTKTDWASVQIIILVSNSFLGTLSMSKWTADKSVGFMLFTLRYVEFFHQFLRIWLYFSLTRISNGKFSLWDDSSLTIIHHLKINILFSSAISICIVLE